MCNKSVLVGTLVLVLSISDAFGGLVHKRSIDGDLDSCIPGSKWAEDCNRCMCTDNGRTVCTSWPCQPYQPDNIYRNGDRRICHLGEVWMQECNVCICTGFGRVSCTSHDCEREIGSINNLERKMERERRETEEKETPSTDWSGKLCTNGEQWKEGCTECECILGTTVCNSAPCLPKEDSSEEIELERRKRSMTITADNSTGKMCNPGSKWKEGCKNCMCGGYGIVLCTLFECQNPKPKPSDEVEVDREKRGVPITVNNATGKLCNPGNKWKEGCKNCMCGDYGMVLCTLEECPQPKQESSEEVEIDRKKRGVPITVNNATGKLCNPGNKWKEGCKNCMCGDYGMVLCTLEECPQPKQESSEEVEIDRKKRDVDNEDEYRPCIPGTTWMQDCNTCTCAGNGMAGCTLMACRPKLSDESIRQRRSEAKCVPGTSWKEDCNRCVCSADGIPGCTLMACHADISNAKPNERPLRQAKCVPGTSWQQDCNRCVCSPEGIPGCTLMACPSQTVPQPNQRSIRQLDEKCVPGTSWPLDCNTCVCSEQGVPMCTLKGCSSQIYTDPNPRTKRDTDQCVQGTSWKEDCNTCFCPGGLKACTRRACSSESINISPIQQSPQAEGQCVEGTSWQEDCNTCWCTNGLKVCTRRGCPSPDMQINVDQRTKRELVLPEDQEKQEKIDQSLRDLEKNCEIGKTYSVSCNMCQCAEIGLVCTKRLCLGPELDLEITEI